MGNLTIPTINRPNECDVITIFPMGVQCFVQNPTNDRSFDGLATLGITGGTPPYTVEWEIGSFAPALSNLGVGEYTATVIDSYGDFTATTTCVLSSTTTTTSTTTLPPQPEQYSNLCMFIDFNNQGMATRLAVQNSSAYVIFEAEL